MRIRKEQEQNSARRVEAWKKWAGLWGIVLSVAFLYMAGCGSDDEPEGPKTRTVSKGGDGNFGSIQDCISASSNGDTCMVYPGTYSEKIDFQGKAITVRSSEGPERTLIDGQGRGTVVTFDSGEDDDSLLDGFTIMNGSVPSEEDTLEHGGGIEIMSAAPVIRNCILLDNYAEGDGGGIYCFSTGSKPEIENVTFQGNEAGRQGGALCAVYGGPDLFNCLFFENKAAAGGAISSRYGAPLVIANCTIAYNSAGDMAGALYLKNSTVGTTNSIYWSNSSPDNRPVVMDFDDRSDLNSDTVLTLSYLDLQGGTSNIKTETCLNNPNRCYITDEHELKGMLEEDPLFVALVEEGPEQNPTQSFYLSQILAGQSVQSVCVDTGDRSAEDAGLEETTTRTDGVADIGTVDLGYHYPTTM